MGLRTFNLFSMLYPGLRKRIRTRIIWKLGPDPHESHNLGALEAQNRAMEGHGRSQWRLGSSKWSPGGSKWSPGGTEDQLSQIRITLMTSSIRIWIRIKVMQIGNPGLSVSNPTHVQINEIFIILWLQAWKSAARRKKRRCSTRIGKMAAYRTYPLSTLPVVLCLYSTVYIWATEGRAI